MQRSPRSLLLLTKRLYQHVRLNSTLFEEVRIPVPWGHVAGKWWGPTDQRPVLTLHGWQDNCGSFDRLIPLLSPQVSFLALDFPGHGYSSRLPSGLYYHFIQYVILIQYIADYFKWPKLSLMGHSMGGIISFMYSMIHPQNVDFLICIDGAKPMVPTDKIAKNAVFLSQFRKYFVQEMSKEEPPSYTLDEIKQKICSPNKNSVAPEHCHHLIERNIAPSKKNPGLYYFTRDPRLKAGELMNWPQEDTLEAVKNMTCPVLIGKAIAGSYYEAKKNFYDVLEVLQKSSKDCQYHRMEGTHHYHLNNPEAFAELVGKFIEKHGSEGRDVGGIKDEIRL